MNTCTYSSRWIGCFKDIVWSHVAFWATYFVAVIFERKTRNLAQNSKQKWSNSQGCKNLCLKRTCSSLTDTASISVRILFYFRSICKQSPNDIILIRLYERKDGYALIRVILMFLQLRLKKATLLELRGARMS